MKGYGCCLVLVRRQLARKPKLVSLKEMTCRTPGRKKAISSQLIAHCFPRDPSGARTLDPQIKSLLLYQLS